MNPEENLIETQFRAETLREILETYGYDTFLGFTINFLTFYMKYMEYVGLLDKDFHWQVYDVLCIKNPAYEEMFDEMVSIVVKYKEIVYEMENR